MTTESPLPAQTYFSSLTTVSCAAVVLAILVGMGCSGPQPKRVALTPLQRMPAPGNDRLQEPVEVRSVNGLLDVTLEVVMKEFDVPQDKGPSRPESLRTYRLTNANGNDLDVVGFPGPTFRVQPGDSVRILLKNELANTPENERPCVSYPASQGDMPTDKPPNCFHGPQNTNIHFHGFHVTPEGSGDNVLLTIKPGEQFQYAFRIPRNQSPGTHWYHPHKHGSVALQVANGMAGAFIVEGGPLDSLANANSIKERILVVQTIEDSLGLVANSGSSLATLINGQRSPVVEINRGEVQRWRFVNATLKASNMYEFVFEDNEGGEPEFYAIARDGVQYAPANYNPNVPETLFVAPGNRLDVFVKASAEVGLEGLEAITATSLHPDVERRRLRSLLLENPLPFLRLNVVEARDDDFANELPPALPALPGFLGNLTPTPRDTSAFVVFSEDPRGHKREDPPIFYLGTLNSPKMQYNPDVDNPFLRMPLNATQTWQVFNRSMIRPHGLAINHPLHIHINPFQVEKVVFPAGKNDPNQAFYRELNDAANRGYPIWLDTIALPLASDENTPGYVMIRQRYDDFTGAFVMHCHILGHEERGMMQLLEIYKP